MITVRSLEKSIKSGAGETFLLRRINLDIKPGEFVSIMGPSGAGKSTLLHILGMHDTDWRGEYELQGQPVHTLRQKDRLALQKKHIGFVFQSYHLLDNLTVYENLEVPLSYRDVPRSQRQSIVSDVLDRFQIVAKKDLYPSQLSGGQQQLVGVARAVVASPGLILADEPTGNLHSDQAREIMELFKKLNDEGTTIIQVTHSETNAQYGNRVIKAARRLDRAMKTALRSLRRTPILSLAAILSLALGIGANTAIFSFFNHALLKRLPVPNPQQLVTFTAPGPKQGRTSSSSNVGGGDAVFSYPLFRDLERGQQAFTGIAAHREISANVAHGNRTSNENRAARVRQLLSSPRRAARARPAADTR